MNPFIQWAEKLRSTLAEPPARQPPPARAKPPTSAPSPHSSAASEPVAEAIIQAQKEEPMKIADWLRAAANVVLTDVTNIFSVAKSAVAAAPLPANIKADLTKTLTDAQSDIAGLASLAGTELGSLIADGVDDATTLFMNLQSAVAKGEPLTAAGAAALKQGAAAITAQIDTLASQAIAGIDVLAAPAPAKVAEPQPAS